MSEEIEKASEISGNNQNLSNSESRDGIDRENAIKHRKEKLSYFFRKQGLNWIFFALLAVLVILTFAVRTSNVPYLKDSVTGNYTLGPDLDPFLFLRYAKTIVETGSLPAIDTMRYVPLGFNTKLETRLLPYSIAYFYKFLHFFNPSITIEYAAIIFPVVCFCISLIIFFFLVRKLFEKNNMKNLIALIATTFLSFIPCMIHRMTAGIPEKECMGFMFLFLTFLFFVYGFTSVKTKKTLIFGTLAGISTGLMAQVWGGVNFTFIIIGLFGFVMVFLNKINRRIFALYVSWFLFTAICGYGSPVFQELSSIFSTMSSLFCLFTIFLMASDLFIAERITKILKIENKTPRILITLLFGISVSIIILFVWRGPAYFSSTFKTATNLLLHPMGTDRITLTVAENNQPFFSSWINEFGLNFIWVFIFAAFFLFYEAMRVFDAKKRIIFTLGYAALILGFIFSRYSPTEPFLGLFRFDGTNSISRVAYFGGAIIFLLILVYTYFSDFYKKREEFNKFREIENSQIFILVWFSFTIIAARGAMRLFMVLTPAVTILISFFSVKLVQEAIKKKEEIIKILYLSAAVLVAIILAMSFVSFYKQTTSETRYTIPNYYSVQWQRAMSWVREETPKDAVFSHWWDYGYWVQSMGERATFLDGGNSYGWWDYIMGRYVLTGENEQQALEVLYSHNVDYLLIDSTEIGKYSAYSSIGSDKNYDRFSWINTFVLDERQTQETKNQTMYVYRGGGALDDDFVWENQIYPKNNAGIGAFILAIEKEINDIRQPEAIIVYGNKQARVPVRYLYMGNKLYDFKDENALQGCLYVIPSISQTNMNNIGAALYISEKGMKALWVHLYFFNEGKYFELVHNEPDVILQELRTNYNLTISDIALYQGNILGPIKIWKVNYPEGMKVNPEYLRTTYPDISLFKTE